MFAEHYTPGADNVERLFSWNYLSDAPQAEPQAAGVLAGLSAEPQATGASAGLSAEPQPAGASAGLSAEPQPVPQAEEAPILSFQPDKFESAIFITSLFFLLFFERFSSLQFLFYRFLCYLEVRTFLLGGYFFVSFV